MKLKIYITCSCFFRVWQVVVNAIDQVDSSIHELFSKACLATVSSITGETRYDRAGDTPDPATPPYVQPHNAGLVACSFAKRGRCCRIVTFRSWHDSSN